MNCIKKKKGKKCNGRLHFAGYASMGGSHSNYYQCRECKAVYEIYDRDEDNPKNYTFLGYSKNDK